MSEKVQSREEILQAIENMRPVRPNDEVGAAIYDYIFLGSGLHEQDKEGAFAKANDE